VRRILDSCGIFVIGDIEDLGRDEGIYSSCRRKEESKSREDDSERPSPGGLRQFIIGVVVGARPIRQGDVSQSSDFIEVEVKQVELGTLARGAVGAAEERETKRRGGGVDGSLRWELH
jgi:hypothetical protein